jgi:hypothetical protein
LNPGTLGGPRKGAPLSWAFMKLNETTGAVSWKVVLV